MYYYSVLFSLAINKGFIYESEFPIPLGMRVSVKFHNKPKIGIIFEEINNIKYIKNIKDIKPIGEVLDSKPVLSIELIKTINFASSYYLSQRGLILRNVLPANVFKNVPIDFDFDLRFQISEKFFFELNSQQKEIYENIDLNFFNVNLIFGITGSGKTEIFLHLIRDVIKSGKNALVLVPEITLTSQYQKIFEEKFLDTVAVYHSQFSQKQRFLEWLYYKRGKKRIMLGTRSASFMDLSNTGLIVVDEENDNSYKQENIPRYNAKDLLIYRAKQLNIPVILSSATPSVETYYKAQVKKKFNIFRLTQRINNCKLPKIEFAFDKKSLLSEQSLAAIENSINEKQMVAILVNRRGFAHFLVCSDCGHIFRCPNCNVSLVYHKKTKDLKCHFCESSFEIPKTCPVCSSLNIRDVGVGTQKMEEFLHQRFKNIKIERLDRDTTISKANAQNIVKKMLEGDIDIIIGTSMISKGYDIENIKLVIISNIESIFALPDFRVDEKIMSLIIQTAGRSGRKEQGKVIIEAKLPQRIVGFVQNTDYEGFLNEEIQVRNSLNYPPFSNIIRVISQNNSDQIAKGNIEKAAKILEQSKVSFLGPMKCPIEKIRNQYRYHIIIKSNSILKTLELIAKHLYDLPLNFDVDPVSFF